MRSGARRFFLGLLILAATASGMLLWRPGLFRSVAVPLAQPAKRRAKTVAAIEPVREEGMVWIEGGWLQIGTDAAAPDDARPSHELWVGGFWLDEHEVTVAQFAAFVEQTGYKTTAERRGWGHVFRTRQGAFKQVAGADWRHPAGPDSSIAGREHWPVVQVSWADAAAYAAFSGKRLPTEAEWEYAARAGLYRAAYPWGNEELRGGRYQANYWQGWFPDRDLGSDGFPGLAPVGSFAPNRYGLYDMAGNAAEWCADWYDPTLYRRRALVAGEEPQPGSERVLRGGSWLSAENASPGILVWMRGHAAEHAATSDIGFRCARDQDRSGEPSADAVGPAQFTRSRNR